MTGTQVKVSTGRPGWLRIPLRVFATLVAAVLVGIVVRQISGALDRTHAPAGFVRGVLQGALMPCALPNLLVGNDVVIYAPVNTGVTYKLGYTCGVNACGAIFFGLFFWRLRRWRKRMNGWAPAPRDSTSADV